MRDFNQIGTRLMKIWLFMKSIKVLDNRRSYVIQRLRHDLLSVRKRVYEYSAEFLDWWDETGDTDMCGVSLAA
jgi:hypothetical protein